MIRALETSEGVRRKIWTREEADLLTEIFPDQRYELIEGELIDAMGRTPGHAYVVALLNEVLGVAFPGRIRVRSPIELPHPDDEYSEPEPDLALLHKEDSQFFVRHPGPDGIALLVEVADTTFRFDRSTKYRLYARTGIQEYWIVDVANRRVVVCRSPQGDEYRSVTIFGLDETISPAAAPEFSLRVAQIFP